MPEKISPNISRLTRSYVDGKKFATQDDVLVFAMNLFSEFERRYQRELNAQVQEAFQSIESHGGILLKDGKEINAFFDDLMHANKLQSFPNAS